MDTFKEEILVRAEAYLYQGYLGVCDCVKRAIEDVLGLPKISEYDLYYFNFIFPEFHTLLGDTRWIKDKDGYWERDFISISAQHNFIWFPNTELAPRILFLNYLRSH